MDPLPMRYFRHSLFVLSLWTLSLAAAAPCSAQTGWREDFEGSTVSWQETESDAPHRILAHERTAAAKNGGSWSEAIRYSVGVGSTLLIEHPTPRLRLIDELRPSVHVASARPGVQFAVRVVLPRSIDPATGKPLSCLLRGDTAGGGGAWQELQVTQLADQLKREARLLRFRLGRGQEVDVREAYVSAAVLNLYTGRGEGQVWIDDLSVAGAVESSEVMPAAYNERPADAATPEAESTAGRVRMRGPVLLVDNRPFLPRMIEYQGESLRFLRECGFNAIRLASPPTPQLAAEAEALGLWIVCPPPVLSPSADADPYGDSQMISDAFSAVLAWDLGHDLAAKDLERTSQLADAVRRADRFRARPLICNPVADLRTYSRIVGAITAERAPLGTTLELADYGTWLRERPRLLAPGTPLWADIQTQLDPLLLEQQSLFSGRDQRRAAAEPEQIRLLVYQAVAAGARGLTFRSSSPLDYQDSGTRLRAKTLQLLNMELELIEPFIAAGQLSALSMNGSRELTAAVLQTESARLLIPIWCGPGAQFVPSQSAGNEISFTVPGVPAAHEPFELTPAGMLAARKKRVTGGTQVTLDDFGLTSLILLTGDSRVQSSLQGRIQRTRAYAAQLACDLANDKLAVVEQLDRTLTQSARAIPHAEEWRTAARKTIEQAEMRLSYGDFQKAYEFSLSAGRGLRMMERAHWDAVAQQLGSPVSSPLTASFATLPDQWRMLEALRGAQPSASLLAGGNFESLPQMVSAGWQHVQHPDKTVKTAVELAPQAARSGKLGLRLRVAAADPATPPGMIESPPVWVASPEVRLAPGTWVRIHGWVKIVSPISGSVDGVMIADSLGGKALAERIGATKGWREFTLYRVVNDTGAANVTIAISGLGEAHLDDVTIEPLGGPGRSGGYPSTQSRTFAPRR